MACSQDAGSHSVMQFWLCDAICTMTVSSLAEGVIFSLSYQVTGQTWHGCSFTAGLSGAWGHLCSNRLCGSASSAEAGPQPAAVQPRLWGGSHQRCHCSGPTQGCPGMAPPVATFAPEAFMCAVRCGAQWQGYSPELSQDLFTKKGHHLCINSAPPLHHCIAYASTLHHLSANCTRMVTKLLQALNVHLNKCKLLDSSDYELRDIESNVLSDELP